MPSQATVEHLPTTILEPAPISETKERVTLIAGDQRMNSVHWLPAMQTEQIRKKLQNAGMKADGDLRPRILLHNDFLGGAKNGELATLKSTGAPFLLSPNHCETESWMAAYQADNLFRDDTPRHLASMYAFDKDHLTELIATPFSWGLVPHPSLGHVSTDKLPLSAFPEIYGEGTKSEQSESAQPAPKNFGNDLLVKYFRNIMRTSGENRREVRARIDQVIAWAKEYRQEKGQDANHADMMNFVLAKVLGEESVEVLTSTFDEFRLDNLTDNSHLVGLLSRWLKDYPAESANYNTAMGHNAEKHQLEAGEFPFWVCLPRGQSNNGETVYKRYTLHKRPEGGYLLKNGVENLAVPSNDTAESAHIDSLRDDLVKALDGYTAEQIAVIPKAHVLISEFGSGNNVLIQPLKPAAYAAEADAYSDHLGLDKRNLYFKVDVWKTLSGKPVKLPPEVAFLHQSKQATGEDLTQLEADLQNPQLRRHLYEALPLLIGLFYQTDALKDPSISLNKYSIAHLKELGLISEKEYRLSAKVSSAILHNIPAYQAKQDELQKLLSDKTQSNSPRVAQLKEELKREHDQALASHPVFLRVVAYLKENFGLEFSLEELLQSGKKYLVQKILSANSKALQSPELKVLGKAGSAIEQDHYSLVQKIEENQAAILSARLQNHDQIQLLSDRSSELEKTKSELEKSKDSLSQKLKTLKSQKADQALVKSVETELQSVQQKMKDTIVELKEVKTKLKELNDQPVLAANIAAHEKSLDGLARQSTHNLLKGSRQMEYSSYYFDPIQAYVGWGQDAVEKAKGNLHFSEQPFV